MQWTEVLSRRPRIDHSVPPQGSGEASRQDGFKMLDICGSLRTKNSVRVDQRLPSRKVGFLRHYIVDTCEGPQKKLDQQHIVPPVQPTGSNRVIDVVENSDR